MKNKGFTLVELLAVIIILTVLATIITPKVVNKLNYAKNVTEQEQINSLINIAKLYTNENTEKLPEKNSTSSITIQELKQSELIKKDQILNPKTKEELTGCIIIEDKNDKYEYEYKDNCNITVTFDPNGGTVSNTTAEATIGKKYDELPTPTKTGYVFKGWTGKNIFDIDNFAEIYAKYQRRKPEKTTFDGYEVYKMFGDLSTAGLNAHYMEGRFKESTQYTISLDIYDKKLGDAVGIVVKVNYTDGTSAQAITETRINDEWQSLSFTSEEDKTISYISLTRGTNWAYSYIKNFQIEEGTEKTDYEPYKKYTNSSSVENVDSKKLNAVWSQAPQLVLSKETYKNIDFKDWTLSANSSASNGPLTVGTDGGTATATSNYIDVNGDFWYMTFDAYTTVPAEDSLYNNVSWNTTYYNSSKETTSALTGNTSNGYAVSVTLNDWNKNMYWTSNWPSQNRYGTNVKYIKIQYKTNTSPSYKAPIIIKNLKVYGQMENSFYLINTEINNGESIIIKKYDKGEKTANYFKTSGLNFEGNQIRVDSNGIYTVYVEDAAGNYSIETIEITNII